MLLLAGLPQVPVLPGLTPRRWKVESRRRAPPCAELSEIRADNGDPQVLRINGRAPRAAGLQSWRCGSRDRLVSALALAHKILRRAHARGAARVRARAAPRTRRLPRVRRAVRRMGLRAAVGRGASGAHLGGDRGVALRAHPRRAGRRAAGPAAGARREPAAARRAAARWRSRRGAPPARGRAARSALLCCAVAAGAAQRGVAPRLPEPPAARLRGRLASTPGRAGGRGRAAARAAALVRMRPALGRWRVVAQGAAARGVHDGAVAARRRARARAAAPPLAARHPFARHRRPRRRARVASAPKRARGRGPPRRARGAPLSAAATPTRSSAR